MLVIRKRSSSKSKRPKSEAYGLGKYYCLWLAVFFLRRRYKVMTTYEEIGHTLVLRKLRSTGIWYLRKGHISERMIIIKRIINNRGWQCGDNEMLQCDEVYIKKAKYCCGKPIVAIRRLKGNNKVVICCAGVENDSISVSKVRQMITNMLRIVRLETRTGTDDDEGRCL